MEFAHTFEVVYCTTILSPVIAADLSQHNPEPLPKRSFPNSRIGLVVLVSLALLPVLGLILYNGYEQRQSATARSEEDLFRYTEQLSAEYSRVVEGTHQLLITLSQIEAIRDQEISNCQAFLAQLKTRFPQYSNIGVIDTNGIITCSAVPSATPIQVSDRGYYQRAIKTRDFSIGDYQVGRITGKPAVNFGYPILDLNRSLRGVVYAGIDLLWLPKLAEGNQLPAEISFSLVDQNGVILTHTPDPQNWIGKKITDPALLRAVQSGSQGTVLTTGPDGVKKLAGYIRLVNSSNSAGGVSIILSEPVSAAYANANHLLATNLIIFAVIALLSISAAWGGAYLFLLRRVSAIVELTRRLAAGDLTARSTSFYEFKELSQLAQAFDELVEALRQQRSETEAATAALRMSEEHYRSLVEMSPEGIYIYNAEQIVFMNETGARMFGARSPDELIGKPVMEMIHPDSHEVAGARIHTLLVDRQPVPLLEEQIQQVDGTPMDVEVIASPALYMGRPAALVLIRDITDRRHAEAARQRWTEEIEALYQTSLQLTSQLDLKVLLEGITERSIRLLGAQIGGVYLVSEDGQSLELVAYRNLPRDMIGTRLKIGEGASGLAAERGELVQVEDYQAFEQRSGAYDGIPFRRVLAVPMKVGDRVIGVITVTDEIQAGPYDPDQIRLAQLFADQAAIAVENARLYHLAQRELGERVRSEENQSRLVAELSALHAVSLAGIEASDLDDLTERVTQIIGEQFFPDDFGIGYFDEKDEVIRFHSSYRIRNGQTIPNIHPGEGISGWVAIHKIPRRVEDVLLEPEYLNADPEVRSEVCVPILLGDRLLGVINAESRQVNAFSLADERLLTSLAGELGIAIEKLRLLGQEQRRRHEAESLRISTAALTSTLDLDRVLDLLLDYLKQVVPYDSVSVMLLTDEHLEVRAERGFAQWGMPVVLPDLDSFGHINEVIGRGRPLIIPDTQEDPRWVDMPMGKSIRCWMGVPLLVRDRVIGIINLDKCEPGYYSPEDAELALAFANQAAMAIENARLYKSELQRNQELGAAREVSEALRVAPTPADMLPIIADQVMELLEADAAGVVLVDHERQEVSMAMGRGIWADLTGKLLPVEIWRSFTRARARPARRRCARTADC